jgi:Ca2+-binding RTX toxin-like protein
VNVNDASVGGNPDAFQTFHLAITDVNEAPTAPTDINNATNSVNAHAINGTALGLTAHSTDPDSGDTVTYHITGGTGQNLFSVDANTGVITVADSTNLNAGSYTLSIDAVDSHGLHSTASSFTINAVQTDAGGPTGIDFVLASSGQAASNDNGNQLNANTLLGHFVATGDPDSGDNFHYALTGTSSSLFSLNTTTGDLSTGGSNLNAQALPYELTITATDQANNSTSTTVDVWVAGSGPDIITGVGANIDIAFGQNGSDTITGGAGSDALIGGQNNDTLTGGLGNDQLVGGSGNDHFVFNATNDGLDTIYDFGNGNDSIDFSNAAFGNLGTGTLSASRFVSGPTETAFSASSGPGFFYNTTEHTLYYDSNGNGAGGLVALAHLANNAALTAADLHIV